MWIDNETDKDLLGYQVHADLLKEIILEKDMLPISIGIFGNWGSGKSSLMLLLQKSIEQWTADTEQMDSSIKPIEKQKNRILQIRFNSWQFESYENTKLTLIETILEKLKKDINAHTDFFEKSDKLLARIKFLKVGSWILKKAFIPDEIMKLLPTEDELKDFLEKDEAEELYKEIANGNSSRFISNFRKCFEDLIIRANYRAIIVYVDDLDRCAPKRVIDCLEAVKLFLNVKHTAFVIGADVRIIEFAIEDHYPIKTEKTNSFSPFSDYLEKLIQLPYKLPKLSYGEQETYITLLLCSKELKNKFNDIHKNFLEFRMSDKHTKYNIEKVKSASPEIRFNSVEKILEIIPLMTQFLNGNPRQLKRFMNTFDIRRRLARVAGFDKIDPTILVKLMVLEYNSLYLDRFEFLHAKQLKGNGIIEDIEEVEKAAIENKSLSKEWESSWDVEWLRRWLKAEPLLTNVNLQNYFWISRDSLENSTPVESLISNYVMSVYNRLKSTTSFSTLKATITKDVSKFEVHDKDMLVMLLNYDLRRNASDEQIWQILQADQKNLIFDDNLDRLKLLFDKVQTINIEPQASLFINTIKRGNDTFNRYIIEISKSFNDQLVNAIKL